MQYDITKLAQKIKTMNLKVLKSNLRHLISEKYQPVMGKGWRIEVAELLGMNKNTFNGMINQANMSKISMETLLDLVEKLELDIDDILADNKIIISNQGRYGNINQEVKWTKERKIEFLTDYKNNSIEYISNKYNLTPKTVETYVIDFKKKIKIL